QVGPSARGVIVLDGTVSEAALQDMDRAGVRGVRLNLASRGFRDAQQIAAMIHAAADRVGPLGWHIQLFTDVTVIQALADTLKHAPVPVVFVRALIAANPNRLVWGTDWLHTASHGHAQGSDPPLIDYRPLDDGHLIDLLADG
ncbi:MAG TPA: amidohydrolase family protein, partial [Xanthobacteraceae bacterium]|nr:amidohydrolase family protein [Xanthobacteraceae bacterium]